MRLRRCDGAFCTGRALRALKSAFGTFLAPESACGTWEIQFEKNRFFGILRFWEIFSFYGKIDA